MYYIYPMYDYSNQQSWNIKCTLFNNVVADNLSYENAKFKCNELNKMLKGEL